MFIASLIPTAGLRGAASEIRIQYTHEHTDTGHNHDDHHRGQSDVTSTEKTGDSQTEKHSHELVISTIALTFIESKSNFNFSFNLPSQSYPKIQNDKLLSSHCLNSIFRPPIST